MIHDIVIEEAIQKTSKTLEQISTTLTLILGVVQDINGKLEVREGAPTHRAGRVDLLVPASSLGLDEETPPEWLEKLRLIPRVIAKINFSITPGCWIYTGVMTQGQMLIYHPHTGRKVTIRRFLYEYLIDPLPDGFKITKPPCNDLCVNPLHLRIPRQVKEHSIAREDDLEFDQYVVGMEKQRKNVAFQNGQKYLQFPMAHWDIVYRIEQGQIVGPKRYDEYLKMHSMYHYTDPIVNTPSRDPSIPTDLEWMNREMGPKKTDGQPAARVKSLAESLGIEE